MVLPFWFFLIVNNDIAIWQTPNIIIDNTGIVNVPFIIPNILIINSRKTWGSKYIERLSNDLKEYGKGYSYDNLNYIAKFASNFSRDEIVEQPARIIPWFPIV